MPDWLRTHILNLKTLTASKKGELEQTVTDWLADGLLALDALDALGEEQQEHILLHEKSSMALAQGPLLMEQSEPVRQMLLHVWNMDHLLCEQPFSSRVLRTTLGVPATKTLRLFALTTLYDIRQPDSPYVSPKDVVQDSCVKRCIGCAVSRGTAEVGGLVAIKALAQCTELSPERVRMSLDRLMQEKDPLLARNKNEKISYALLTEKGVTAEGKASGICAALEFRAPILKLPPLMPELATLCKTRMDHRIGRFVSRYCYEGDRPASLQLFVALQQAIQAGQVVLRRQSDYPDAPCYGGYYLELGPALARQPESAQKARIYSLGFSRFVYGHALAREDVGGVPD